MRSPEATVHARDHLVFSTAQGPHLLLTEGSQLFRIDEALAERLRHAAGAADTRAVLAEQGLGLRAFVDDAPLVEPPLRALSLAVAERCNLGCTYCYAEGGSFGGRARAMDWPVAEAAVQRLFAEAKPGERVNLAFMGGEPLSNRDLVRRATVAAVQLAGERGVEVGFSITTNGTLLTEQDADFFERHGFAVTVSLDGVGAVHDRLRPTKGGRPSYERIVRNLQPLLERQRRMQVGARVTVTPDNLNLRETLDRFVEMGFWSVGFSPLLSAPSGQAELRPEDLARLLHEMVQCGHEFERRVAAGEPYPFANLMSALEEIHRGTHRPYPCGAGAGYFGVSADGGLYACHRFVGDEARAMGHVQQGVDRPRQALWLSQRRVETQEPCGSCWARYLCGGGCHYEALHRGRPACDYIRGWLEYALGVYVRLRAEKPAVFASRTAGARARPGGSRPAPAAAVP